MKKILSVIVCMVMLVGLFPCTEFFNVSAASVEQITANQTWHESWDGTTKYVYLTVDQTGYYDLNVTDFAGEALVDIYIADMEFETTDGYWYNSFASVSDYIETHTRENLYLIKDHLYQIAVAYGDYDADYNFIQFYADLSITFTKTDYTPIQLTLGGNKNIFIGSNIYEWLEFKTTAAGDYLFVLNDYADFNLEIYEKVSGEYVKFTYFDYYKTTRLTLKSNTEYIIKTSSGEKSDRLVRLNVSKATNNVTNIDLIQGNTIWADDFSYSYEEKLYLNYEDYSSFQYQVTYSDKSKKTFYYEDLMENGISINDIICLGEFDKSYTDEIFIRSGNQPVQIVYMDGKTSKSNIYVTSYVEWLISIEAAAITDFKSLRMTYEDGSDVEGYWLIKPDETNNYEIYSSEWYKLDIDFFIFDQNNALVPYKDGYNLKAGNLYSLRAVCTFSDYYSNGFTFSYEPNREHIHTHTNACDTTCNICKATRSITHSYKTTTTKATLTKNGSIVKKCTVCGKVASSTTIKYAKTFKLSTTTYTYNGGVKTPTVTVKDSAGKTLKKNTDYTVTYAAGRKNVGTYKVTVKMKGNYSGTKTLTFKINPAKISSYKLSATSYTYDGKVKKPTVTVKNSSGTKLTTSSYTVTYSSGRKNVGTYKVTIKGKGNYTGTKTLTFKINPVKTTVSKLTAGKKSITVVITKKSTQVTGYQIQYSTSKKFTSAKTKTISSYKTTKTTLKSLSAKKTYYVRVRTYKKVGGTTYYSGWSTYKYVKTK